MKQRLAILCFVLFSSAIFAKGAAGTYYISGIATGANKAVLANTELTVTMGRLVKTVRTDSSGRFMIEIPWQTACPSGISPAKRRRETAKLNPKYIYIACNSKQLKLNNIWRKYVGYSDTKEALTKKQDLSFV